MKTKSTLIDLLLKQSEMYLRDLPETIRIPALDGNRSDEVVRPLEDATIDDLAFAIQGMEAAARVHIRRLQGLRERQSLTRDTVGKRFSGDELHGNKCHVPIGGDVVNGDDVGMVQRRRGFRLLSETADPFAVGGPARRQYLDGDKAVQVSVTRLVHNAHPAFAQFAGDGVMEQALAQHNGVMIPRT